jgi:hypothetical protein
MPAKNNKPNSSKSREEIQAIVDAGVDLGQKFWHFIVDELDEMYLTKLDKGVIILLAINGVVDVMDEALPHFRDGAIEVLRDNSVNAYGVEIKLGKREERQRKTHPTQ